MTTPYRSLLLSRTNFFSPPPRCFSKYSISPRKRYFHTSLPKMTEVVSTGMYCRTRTVRPAPRNGYFFSLNKFVTIHSYIRPKNFLMENILYWDRNINLKYSMGRAKRTFLGGSDEVQFGVGWSARSMTLSRLCSLFFILAFFCVCFCCGLNDKEL